MVGLVGFWGSSLNPHTDPGTGKHLIPPEQLREHSDLGQVSNQPIAFICQHSSQREQKRGLRGGF